jgi:hypothetical protein
LSFKRRVRTYGPVQPTPIVREKWWEDMTGNDEITEQFAPVHGAVTRSPLDVDVKGLTVTSEDSEVEAIRVIIVSLGRFSPPTRNRILTYVNSRYASVSG